MTSTRAYDILLFGEYFFDVIFGGLRAFPALGQEVMSDSITTTGGAMFITACALARLGARIGWPATFGNDNYSEFVAALARREGIDLSLSRTIERPVRRVTTSMPFQGERAFITFTDEAPDDAYSFWLETMLQTSFRHIHFGGLEHSSVIGPLTSLAHDRGATVSMDCYDTPLLHDPECDWPCLLYGVDVFMPNAREARLITKRPTVRDALLNLCEYVPRVVIKDGPHGAWIGVGSSIEHVETVTVGDVIDTTGAGDCFNAGYLFGSVVLGLPDAEAARCGNICGAFSVTGIGGATAAPTRAQLDSILMAMPGR